MKRSWKIMDIISILMIVVAMTVAGCCGCGNYKYHIRQGDLSYTTNDYTKGPDGCITFNNLSNGETPVTICGTYTIEENKSYKPAKSDAKFRR